MRVQFLYDPDTQLPHLYKHGVTEEEVHEVLQNYPLTLRGKHGAKLALGQTDAGRYLKAIYRERSNDVLIITAYALVGKALHSFRRRRRKRQ